MCLLDRTWGTQIKTLAGCVWEGLWMRSAFESGTQQTWAAWVGLLQPLEARMKWKLEEATVPPLPAWWPERGSSRFPPRTGAFATGSAGSQACRAGLGTAQALPGLLCADADHGIPAPWPRARPSQSLSRDRPVYRTWCSREPNMQLDLLSPPDTTFRWCVCVFGSQWRSRHPHVLSSLCHPDTSFWIHDM